MQVHVVFQQYDVVVLQEAIKIEETLAGEIVEIKDEFGVGPIAMLATEEGWAARLDWWRRALSYTHYGSQIVGSFDDRKTVERLKEKLLADEAAIVWIWIAPNQHDVTGYYWLIQQLKDFQGRVFIIYINNLPFINSAGQIFYPNNLSEVLPKEIVKARVLARPVTFAEFEMDGDEWLRLSNENSLVRILEGAKKIVGQSADFYDEEILKHITGEWQKATRVVSSTLQKMKIKTGDVYLVWRLNELIQAGVVEASGELGPTWKNIELRLLSQTTDQQINE